MKNTINIIISALIFIIFTNMGMKAQSSFGVFAGLATPSDLVNQVYNTDLIKSTDVTGVLLREAAISGYTIGARIRQNIDEQFWFTGGVSLARFPQSVIPIINQANALDTLAIMTTIQNVVPIQAGMMYQFNKGLVSLYVIGDVTYNYLMNSVDVVYNNQSFPLPPEDETKERIGFGVGMGLDVHLKVITASLEAKMNTINFIGRSPSEPEKRFFSLTLGVHFGQTQSDKP
ncbi:MAG: hypothetical protein ACKOX1_01695 [Ignavibacteria bacterium]